MLLVPYFFFKIAAKFHCIRQLT